MQIGEKMKIKNLKGNVVEYIPEKERLENEEFNRNMENIECSSCHGTGEINCPCCGGTGTDPNPPECFDCNGRGIIECDECEGTGFKDKDDC
jgi:DnaJ-class molecular chaperone